MKKEIIGPTTLIPLSAVALVFTCAFWLSGLAKDTSANASEIKRVESSINTISAEVIQQMRSQQVTMSQIQLQSASTEAKVSVLLKMAEKERQNKYDRKNH